MSEDLSKFHQPIGDLFARPKEASDWDRYRLSAEQSQFYETNGYLSGLRLLHDNQVAALRAELGQLTDPSHPGNELFYEFHSNESTNPNKTLFMRWAPGALPAAFMTCCGIRRS